MARGERAYLTVWGGSRVRLRPPALYAGQEGVNLGRRRLMEGGVTLLIRLDGGTEIRVPEKWLEKVEKEKAVAPMTWFNDVPGDIHRGNWVSEISEIRKRGNLMYQVRGYSGRWFVQRDVVGVTEPPKRSKFYPNQKSAIAAFNELTA